MALSEYTILVAVGVGVACGIAWERAWRTYDADQEAIARCNHELYDDARNGYAVVRCRRCKYQRPGHLD